VRPGRIKIVYVINSLGVGGAERFAADLACHLDRDRFQPRFLCLYYGGQFVPGVKAAGIPVEVIGVSRKVVPANWAGVWSRLGTVTADVVHTHLHEAAWYGLPAAYLRRIPVRISHLHGDHWSWPRKLRWLDRAVETFASTSLACSTAVGEFARAGLRYPPEKLRVVPNATDLERFQRLPSRDEARASLELPRSAPILTCVASLTEAKGQTFLLQAMRSIHAELPEARLLLVGRDRGKTDLSRLAQKNGLGRSVSILGPREDVPLLLAASDIAVLPSLREGLPLSLVESAAAGLPAVATTVGGIPDVVEDGISGTLVPPGDPTALATAILGLLRDRGRRSVMAEAARWVGGRFDIRTVTRELEELYVSMLARRRGTATLPPR